MDTQDSYQRAAEKYAAGVRALFAPTAAPGGERGGGGAPAPDTALAERGEALLPISTRLTQAAAEQLAAPDPVTRAQASTKLLAKAVADLQVSAELLQAAEDEEAGVAPQPRAARGSERSTARAGTIDEQLDILLGHQDTQPTRSLERGGDAPRNLDEARVNLTNSIQDALTLISERAAKAGQTALGGLLGLGAGELAKAAGAVGMDIAQALGQAEKVTRLYNLFRDFVMKAFESLLALIGQPFAQTAANKVLEWVDQLKSGTILGDLLEKLYGTRQTEDELGQMVGTSQAQLDKFVVAIEGVDGLDATYRQQIGLAEKALKLLGFVGGLPAAVIPAGRLILAAAYIVLGAYVIFAGADFLDAKQSQLFKRVPGVRELVTTNLA